MQLSHAVLSGHPLPPPCDISPLEKHFTIYQVAEAWAVSAKTVSRTFQDLPGVLKLKGPHGHVTLRIPASVLERFRRERSR